MIVRLLALLVLLYLLGFLVFGVTLGRPAGDQRTDAAVVVTGGSGRIERGVAVVARGEAKRLLIAGADPSVSKSDVARLLKLDPKILACCVDLGSESVDTRSNAEEAKRWLDAHRFRSFRLITSDWHMRRTRYEFNRVFGDGYTIVPDAVHTEPQFMTLFAEYNKYILRRIAVLIGL